MTSSAITTTVAPDGVATRGTRPVEPLVYELSEPGLRAVDLPPLDVPPTPVPEALAGPPVHLPEIGQHELVGHYTRLSRRTMSLDASVYPLGSCTMKYNPRVNEWAAALPGFARLHPLQDERSVQGALRLLYETRCFLQEIAGLHEVSLQPAAGAHGEFTALTVIRAHAMARGETDRTIILAPDTAHGTNPATCTMCGMAVRSIPTDEGLVDPDVLRRMVDESGPKHVLALMITNPNTAGLFDASIGTLADILHEAGAMLYLDGANMNAILGRARPGDFGVDAMHFNTHKTFSTPHGCGGPGAGPIAVTEILAPYLPVPQVVMDDAGAFHLDRDRPASIGKVRGFHGQFGVLVRCWAYIAACGPHGLRRVAETAVLNANYLAARLRERYAMPFFRPEEGRFCAHEFVTVPRALLDRGVTLVDIAKRLIDFDIHPPTIHWPVRDCLMVEPTETQSKRSLDHFVDVMHAIADEIEADPSALAEAPRESDITRADEVAAARNPVLTWEG